MKCVRCGQELLAAEQQAVSGEFRNETITVSMEARRCPSCGHQRIGGGQMAEFAAKVADAYREQHGLLTSNQLRELRTRLRMSQAAFARHVEIGVASLKRWERGEIQSEQMDRTVRLRTDLTFAEAALDELCEETLRQTIDAAVEVDASVEDMLREAKETAEEETRRFRRSARIRLKDRFWLAPMGKVLAAAA